MTGKARAPTATAARSKASARPRIPGTNPLCAYTVEKTNPKGEIHHVCVTADGRLLDGNTGASRPNIFLQPYMKPDGKQERLGHHRLRGKQGRGHTPGGYTMTTATIAGVKTGPPSSLPPRSRRG